MRKVKQVVGQGFEDNNGKRRLILTRLLIWAEQEATDLGRHESARHINLAIGELFDKSQK